MPLLPDRERAEWADLVRDIEQHQATALYADHRHFLCAVRDNLTRPLDDPSNLRMATEMTAEARAVLHGVRLGLNRAILAFDDMRSHAEKRAVARRGQNQET